MVYGKRIKEVRLLLKMKQKDMAMRIGISQAYLCGIENGSKQPNAQTIIKLINEFHVNALWLKEGVCPVFLNNDEIVYIKSAEIKENEPSYNFPILKEYLEEILDIALEKLIYFKIESDNMEPTIKVGDIVLIDTSLNKAETEGIYLFEINSRKLIRRVVFIPEKQLLNDNPSIKNSSILFDNSLACIGKVIWFGRKI